MALGNNLSGRVHCFFLLPYTADEHGRIRHMRAIVVIARLILLVLSEHCSRARGGPVSDRVCLLVAEAAQYSLDASLPFNSVPCSNQDVACQYCFRLTPSYDLLVVKGRVL